MQTNSEHSKLWVIGVAPVLIYINSFAIGVETVLLCLISLVPLSILLATFRKRVSVNATIPFILLLITGVMSVLQMLIHAYWFPGYNSLQMIFPLLTVNTLVIVSLEQALQLSARDAMILSLKTCLVVAPVFILTGFVREYSALSITGHAAGCFLLLAFFTAAIQYFCNDRVSGN